MKIQAGGQTIEKSGGSTIQDTTRGIDNRPKPAPRPAPKPAPTYRKPTPTIRSTVTPKPTPAPASKPTPTQQPTNVRATGALKQAFQGVPFLGSVANIVDRYNRRANYADRSPEERRMLGLKNSYEPQGEVISEKRKLKSPQEVLNKIPGYYDGKPAPLGFPVEQPPKMVNGMHPDLVDGKKVADRFNRLDPISAKAMPITGNPHIDKKVKAARKKPK